MRIVYCKSFGRGNSVHMRGRRITHKKGGYIPLLLKPHLGESLMSTGLGLQPEKTKAEMDSVIKKLERLQIRPTKRKNITFDY